MFSLTGFRAEIEKLLGQGIDNADLVRAVEAAGKDLVVNHLMMGKDVTAEQFKDVVTDCVKTIRRGA